MGSLHVDHDGTRRTLEGLDDAMTLETLLELVREAFAIDEQDYYRYRLLAHPATGGPFGPPDIKNLVDPSKSLGYVREEFDVPWGTTMILQRVE